MAASYDEFGNPSSLHSFGRRARELVEDARERVAAAVGASPNEIVFTGSGTEADNIALKGASEKLRGNASHIVTTAFEHHAVLDTVEWLGHNGWDISIASVPESGVVDPQEVGERTRSDTALVSVMAVNNELGTIQPVADIATAVRAKAPRALVHTDAVQALGNMPVDLHAWGVALAAFSAHKLGGPKGVGALFVRSGVAVAPLFQGGGHERGLRSGTLNVSGIAGFGIAAEIAAKELDHKRERLSALRDRLLEAIKTSIESVSVNADPDARIAGNINVSFEGADGETMLLLLDRAGIAASTGSACQSGAVDPSHVLLAIGMSKKAAAGSLRFSLGRDSTEADVDAVIEVLPGVVEQARKVNR